MRISDWSSDVCSSDLIDQSELHRLAAAVRRAVDEIAHRRGLQVARPGDRCGDLRDGRVQIALQVLALRLGQRVLGEEAHRALVFLALGDLGLCADVLKSEEHTSELQSLMRISYTVLC